MGAFKIQTDLDLSGFNLLNFCIQSYTDLENVPNLGLGRKLFFTGNSTDEKNLREVIWDGVEWKAAAYLDDIEAITTGEGSLGTRVKALEDMLKVDDANDVINTWAEIQAFLDNVKEGTDLMTMLDGKLDKTGGTITGTETSPLTINTTATREIGLRLNMSGASKGWFGYTPNTGVHMYSYGTGSGSHKLGLSDAGVGFLDSYTLIHSGNYATEIGDYYLKSSGGTLQGDSADLLVINRLSGTSSAYITFKGNNSLRGRIGFDANNNPIVQDINYGSGNQTLIHSGNIGEYALKVDGSNAMTGDLQLLVKGSGSANVAVTEGLFIYRGPSPGGTDVGLPDNYINVFNVGGANAYSNLQLAWRREYPNPILYARIGEPTAYSDWKTIAFTDSTVAAAKKLTTDSHVYASFSDTGKYLLFGATAAEQGYNTYVDGYNIHFRYGGGYTSAMTITEEGAVNVGEGGLNVATTLKVGASDGTSSATIYMQRNSGNYIWANNAGGSIAFGVKDVGNPAFNTASLAIFSDRITSGTRNNEVSLGFASYRWSNVYSTLGDFNGAVTIHSNADGAELLRFDTERPWKFSQIGTGAATGLYLSPDATSKIFVIAEPDNSNVFVFGVNGNYSYATFNSSLAVANLATFNGGALIPTGQTLTIGSVTFRETAAGEVEVDGNLHTTGTLASGGKAAVGEGDTGGGGNANVYSDVLEGVITQEWEVGNPFQKEDVIVSLYMWNTDESRWEMVLADIGVTSENIWVTFGRPTSTTDKYMAVVMG